MINELKIELQNLSKIIELEMPLLKMIEKI